MDMYLNNLGVLICDKAPVSEMADLVTFLFRIIAQSYWYWSEMSTFSRVPKWF